MEKEAAGRPLTRKLIKYDRPEPVSDVCASLAEKKIEGKNPAMDRIKSKQTKHKHLNWMSLHSIRLSDIPLVASSFLRARYIAKALI